MLISVLHLPLVNNNHNKAAQRGAAFEVLASSLQLLDPPLPQKERNNI